MRHRGIGLAAVLLGLATPLAAQDVTLRGYALNVALGAASSPFSKSALQDIQRLRLMAGTHYGPLSAEVAYEHVLTLSSVSGASSLASLVGVSAERGDWMPLQGTLAQGDYVVWRHRLDRASIQVATDFLQATVGRQTISWATTLFLTPADPFAPFDPADPFRDYRAGVDAARVRVFPSPFSEIDGAVRIAEYGGSRTTTALLRGKTTVGGVDLAGWGGVLHDRGAGSIGVTTVLAGAALRGEVVVRAEPGKTAVRAAAGVDRSFTVGNKTLYAVVEYQHDDFGVTSIDSLSALLSSAPYQRGELQVLGRDEVMAQASYQIHPLVQVAVLTLWNARDYSVLFTPSLSWNAAREVTLTGGVFAGAGEDRTPQGLPATEYGPVPVTWYASGTVYF
jgi:hypothetical protein